MLKTSRINFIAKPPGGSPSADGIPTAVPVKGAGDDWRAFQPIRGESRELRKYYLAATDESRRGMDGAL
jgi:hypothetical protein